MPNKPPTALVRVEVAAVVAAEVAAPTMFDADVGVAPVPVEVAEVPVEVVLVGLVVPVVVEVGEVVKPVPDTTLETPVDNPLEALLELPKRFP